jgi:UDP-N-acetylglucosamine 2-epimerase (non-hydrolysing)
VNLRNEGIPDAKVHFVGNVMIDTLVHCLGQISEGLPYPDLREREYAVVTLHRPSNVDRRETLQGVLKAFHEVSRRLTLVMPLHPRTLKRIEEFGLGDDVSAMGRRAIVTEPIGYLEMLRLVRSARMVITDSGGIQEETTYLGVPCLTMRENSERPSTITLGTNTLVGSDTGKLLRAVDDVMAGSMKRGTVPPLWDGKAAARIVDSILSAM